MTELQIADPRHDPTARPYIGADSDFVTVDGVRLHMSRTGQGHRIVLLHGSGASLHIFGPVTERLASHFEVIRLDLPAFGLTGPRADGDYTVTAYVSLLAQFLAEHVDGPFLLAGHSFGGQLAWTYALDHPARLAGLVLMNATGYPQKSLPLAFRLARTPLLRPILRRVGSRAATARNLVSLVGPGSGAVDDAMVDRVHALMSRPGQRSAFVDFANTDQPDRSPEIPQITTPTLVLRSDLVDGRDFARDIPGSRDVLLAGVGHLMPAEVPSAVATAIERFADEIDMQEA